MSFASEMRNFCDASSYARDMDREGAIRAGSERLLASLNGQYVEPPRPVKFVPSETRTPISECNIVPIDHLFGTALVKSVGNDFGLTLDQMRGQERWAMFIDARAVVTRLMRDRGLSYPQIGRWLGGRDHSTTINLYKKFDIYARRNPAVMLSYNRHKDMK